MKKKILWFRQSNYTKQIAYWYWVNFLAKDSDLDSFVLWQHGYKWKCS